MTTNAAAAAGGSARDAVPVFDGPVIDGSAFDKAHHALLSDSSIQFDFTIFKPPPPPPQWIGDFADWLGKHGPAFRFLFWAVAALVVALLLYLIFRFVEGRWKARAGAVDAATAQEWRPEEAAARELLREAEALAARGDYAGAARLLLLRSIEDIQSRKPDFVKPALTSREIARAETLPPAARTAFAMIAGRVEASHFAARGLDEAGWRECRRAYEDFAFDRAWM